jgi:hypothetical protein
VRRADEHATDDELVGRYFDPDCGDDRLELHLFRCAACSARRDSLAAWLDADHEKLRRETDAYFGEARLAVQRTAVLARLGGAPSTARVLPFPAPRAGAAAAPGLPMAGGRKRLIAAAAILAMVGGAGAGWVIEVQRHDRLAGRLAHQRLAAPAEGPRVIRVGASDEMLLTDIETALSQPRAAELLALDALTPHAFDLSPGR